MLPRSVLQDPKQTIVPQSAPLGSAAVYKPEQTSSQSGRSNFCFHAVSSGVSGTTGQRDSVGRDPWGPLVDWKHQTVVLVLYRLIFKPLKILLTGRKLVPDSSFAATTVPAGKGRPCPVQVAALGRPWASAPSERPEAPGAPRRGVSRDSAKGGLREAGARRSTDSVPGGPRGHFPSFTCVQTRWREPRGPSAIGSRAGAAVRTTAIPRGPGPSLSFLFSSLLFSTLLFPDYKIMTCSLYICIMCM